VFRALADNTRREILDVLFEREGQPLRELEARFDMTRFGVMKHVQVLEEAGRSTTAGPGSSLLETGQPLAAAGAAA
jgi:DNA-binding transcriptional ArsR family regulator